MIAVWLSAGRAEPAPKSATVRVLPSARVPAGVASSTKSGVSQWAAVPVTSS